MNCWTDIGAIQVCTIRFFAQRAILLSAIAHSYVNYVMIASMKDCNPRVHPLQVYSKPHTCPKNEDLLLDLPPHYE